MEILHNIRKSHQSLVIDPDELILGDVLGTGTTGEVVMGILRGTKVAVKRYHPHILVRSTGLDEFKSEVSTMMNLVHPNIMLLLGYTITNNRLSIVTEYIHCGSLSNLLYDTDESLLISPKRRLEMVLDIARGMAYLHSRSPAIVHRDLKPSNLLVDSNWRVKICDVSSICMVLLLPHVFSLTPGFFAVWPMQNSGWRLPFLHARAGNGSICQPGDAEVRKNL
jgi:serine/threonine protein kinase